MECAGKGSTRRCIGSATRRCGGCGAVAYCSASHQLSHWSVHKDECERLGQQMKHVDMLNDFPFTFSEEATYQVCEKLETRCSFLAKQGIHCIGMWMSECSCGSSVSSSEHSRLITNWNLSSICCPCRGPSSLLQKQLSCWKDYYEWRGIPLNSPVAVLLHWPMTIYKATQLASEKHLIPEINDEVCIHYLGPERELHQLSVFSELHALFPGVRVRMELVGPAIPQSRNDEKIVLYNYTHCIQTDCTCKSLDWRSSPDPSAKKSSEVALTLHSGYYHECFGELAKESPPHLIIAPNAGIAAYKSWLPTIELIKEINAPAIYSDYCEEAAHLAANCISSVTGHPPTIPVQLNPFRQPLAVEDSPLLLPCYSNCFLFGM